MNGGKAVKSSGIGGQAVLEGIMMKYKSDYSIAVRKPDGEINIIHGKCTSISEKSVFFRLPIIRGITSFIESMTLGIRTLTYSADYYEEEENIKTKAENEQKNKTEKLQNILIILFAIALALVIFIILPFYLSQILHNITVVESPTMLAVIEGVIRIVLFIGYVLAISLMKDIKRVFMYHGAEHKSINCVENGLPLTVENVRTQSKHHKRCGTNFLFIVMFLSIVCFMFISFENIFLRIALRILLVPVIAGISYEFIRFAGNTDNKIINFLSKPGMLMQKLTTREPDDEMIEVAIAAIEAIFDWRGYQRRQEAIKNRQEKKARSEKNTVHKSRAQLKEELLKRERENKQRAEEHARMLKEMEEREAELERIAEEAMKRKESGHGITIPMYKDIHDENLIGLDHFLNLEETSEVEENKVIDDKDSEKHSTKEGAKVINFSDYK